MRIIQLTVENIKKLKVVSITPKGDIIEITGANGEGKSSVLDAILYALAGTSYVPSKPVRNGEEKAIVKLDLGELLVTRKFNREGATSLTVEAANGAVFRSPQAMLDALLGQLTFDPLAFSRADTKKQLEVLKSVVKLDANLDELDAKNQLDFNTRTAFQRTVKNLEGELNLHEILPSETPDEEVDVTALVQELEKAGEANAEIEKHKAAITRKRESIENVQREIDEGERIIKDLQERIEQQRKSKVLTQKKNEQYKQELAQLEDTNRSPVDTSAIKEKISQAQATNKQVALKKRKRELEEKIGQAKNESLQLTGMIKERMEKKQAAIASAKMPVPGLTFGEGEVLLNGLPLNQASSAEQLQVSVGIAMALNPKLRVLRIQDGSLLDERSMKLLAKMAEERDYQIWVERVDLSGKVGIVMEDGQVKSEEKVA